MTVNPEKVKEVRNWFVDNINRENLTLPNDDAIWEFITTKWPNIPTEEAEKLLNESLKNIPFLI